jgi:hypothetical protein
MWGETGLRKRGMKGGDDQYQTLKETIKEKGREEK